VDALPNDGMDMLRQQKENRKRGARTVPGPAAPHVPRATPPPPPIVTSVQRSTPATTHQPTAEPGSPQDVPDGGVGRAPVSRFWRNPENPREEGEFDLENDDELKAMSESVGSYGILQPLNVVERTVWVHRHPEHEEVIPAYIWYVIQLGSTRHYLAEHHGIEFLKFTRDDSLADPVRAIESRLIENFHRRTLHPIMEANELRRLIEEKGVSQRALAASIGYDPMAVTRSLQLLKLIPQFQAIVVRGKPGEGELSPEKARPIAALPTEQQKKLFAAGWPYSRAKLNKPEEKSLHEAAEKVTRVRISIPSGSGPEDLVKALTGGVEDPEMLNEVVELLVRELTHTFRKHAEAVEAQEEEATA
jgi:ParB/RepB/Spo0J family partition protein